MLFIDGVPHISVTNCDDSDRLLYYLKCVSTSYFVGNLFFVELSWKLFVAETIWQLMERFKDGVRCKV
jgi:hypothetical protein